MPFNILYNSLKPFRNISKTYILEKILLIFYYLQFYYNFVYNYFYNIFQNYFDNNYELIFIKNDKIIQKNKHTDIIEIPKSDYVVTTHIHNNIKLITVVDDYSLSNSSNKIICDYSFMLVLLYYKEEKYDITGVLKNSNHSFYIKDAILFDPNFINWMVINYIKIKIDDYKNIRITIIDHRADDIELSNKQYIKLDKDTYNILELCI